MFSTRSKIRVAVVLALICAALVVSQHARLNIATPLDQPVHAASAPPPYTLFESGQVRPLAMSPDRTQLFAVNTPNGTLEVFDIGATQSPTHRVSIPVGLEPVAVAARNDSEVNGRASGVLRGYVYRNGSFTSDRANQATLSITSLKLLAQTAGQELTFTAVPTGSGVRMGIDRDLDGVFNGDE